MVIQKLVYSKWLHLVSDSVYLCIDGYTVHVTVFMVSGIDNLCFW